MARLLNAGNRADTVRAVDRLAPGPDDHVLELGFGGGEGLVRLLARGCRVTGVEPAVAMRARALRKHAWDVAKGRLVVVDGAAEALPDGPFDRALSLNTVYFWDDVDQGCAELARVVRGTVVLGVALRAHLQEMGFPDSGFRTEDPEWYGQRLEQAGFTVQVEPPVEGTLSCALVIGQRR